MSTPTIITVLIPAVVLIVGLFIWRVAKDPDNREAGKIAFVIGLFWLVGIFARDAVKF